MGHPEMKVAIVIPTYNRIKKLHRCLQSIYASTYRNWKIYVYCDALDVNTAKYISENYSKTRVVSIVNDIRKYAPGSWNDFPKRFEHEPWNAMMWCVDDAEVYPDALTLAISAMEFHYPDTDGVIGFAQECPGHEEYTYKPYGQVLLGRTFVNRYPDGQVCCPAYKFLYQDEELHLFAESMGKFHFCEGAKLKHYHPAFIKSEMDETHALSRGDNLREDRFTYAQRRTKNLIWGQTFEL